MESYEEYQHAKQRTESPWESCSTLMHLDFLVDMRIIATAAPYVHGPFGTRALFAQ